jgi:hypothetical protein
MASVAPSKTPETLFLLDWDDTLMATTEAQTAEGLANSKRWRELQGWVKHVLLLARMYGSGVYIVTNSEKGWVEMSMARFMPELKTYADQLNIVSARSLYETGTQTGEPLSSERLLEWKTLAFLDILQTHRKMSSRTRPPTECGDLSSRTRLETLSSHKSVLPQIVSFGDSALDIGALERAAAIVDSSATIKWVKFQVRPTFQQLIQQLSYVASILVALIQFPGKVYLELTAEDVAVSTNISPPSAIPITKKEQEGETEEEKEAKMIWKFDIDAPLTVPALQDIAPDLSSMNAAITLVKS